MYKPTAIDRTVGDGRSERLPTILHSGTKRSRGQEAKPCENGPPENRCKRRHKWRGGWISHQRRNYLFEYESAIRTNLSINETTLRLEQCSVHIGHNNPSSTISSSYCGCIRWKQQYGQACTDMGSYQTAIIPHEFMGRLGTQNSEGQPVVGLAK